MSSIGWFLLGATIGPGVSWWRAGHRGIAGLFALVNGPGYVLIALSAHVPHGGLIFTALVVVFQLAFLVQSALGARAVRRSEHRQPWSTTVVFFGAVIVAAIPSRILQARITESFIMPSNSMSPSLMVGDQVMVAKSARLSGERGAVIVFKSPDSEFNYMKRVVGLAGDSIAIHKGRLSINGNELVRTPCEEELVGCELENSGARKWRVIGPPNPQGDGEWTVPAGTVFVLGDNRSNSSDSRHFGAVPVANIIGVARDIHFSWPDVSRSFRTIDPQ